MRGQNDTPTANKLYAANQTASFGVEKYANSYSQAYWDKIAPGLTQDQISQIMRTLPAAQAQAINNGAFKAEVAGLQPESVFDKVMQKLALGASMIGVGGIGAAFGGAAAGAAGATAGSTSAAAISGAAGGAFTGAAGAALTGQSIGKGALIGGVTGAVGSIAKPAVGALNNATGIGSTASTAIVKGALGAGTSALGAKLSGGNVGNSAIIGGAGGFISGAVGNATGSNVLGKLAGAAGTNFLGSTLQPNSPSGSPVSGGGKSTGNMGMAAVGAGMVGAGLSGGVGGQGNIGNMAGTSTDSTLAQTITGALPGVLQGAAGVYGAQNAAEKQTQADENAIKTQQSTLGNINDIWKTQQGLGQGADTALGSALGTNGKPADYSGFENMPGYKFAVGQGTQAIQRQAASMGSAYTPNTAQAVGSYVTGTAMQDYNTYINQLMGAAGLGSTANTGIANPTYATGANISTLQQNEGQAQASGVMGASNAVGGIFGSNGVGSSLIGAAGKFLGGGSNGGGGGGGGGPTGSGVSGGGLTVPGGAYDFGGGADYGSTNFGGGLDYGNGGGSNDYFSTGGFNFLGNDTGGGGGMNFGGGLDFGGSGSDWGWQP